MGDTISNTLYILGAGFTRAANGKAPLNRELLEAMMAVNPDPLNKYRDKYQSTDIERILTLIYLDADTNSHSRDDLKLIDNQIANYFTRFRFDPQTAPAWVSRFSKNVLQPNDSILCLNYDCYLEGALDHFKVWSPNGGYPINHPLADDIMGNPRNIKIYKIHGSEHFRESRVIGSTGTDISFLINESNFPESGRNKHFGCGLDSKPYVVAPSFVKDFHVGIAWMMLRLLEIAKEARNLVIIGCGMRREDSFLWLVLTRFLFGNPKDTKKKLIIVDPSSVDILNRMELYAGDISELADVVSIPSGIEDGTADLMATMGYSS